MINHLVVNGCSYMHAVLNQYLTNYIQQRKILQ